MTHDDVLAFVRRHRLAVVATVSADATPSAALIGIAASDDFELVFDTLHTSQKGINIGANGKVAMVVGWDGEKTLQIDGIADAPQGAELERIRKVYFEVWPDGRARLTWPGLIHVRVRPTRLRYSDFSTNPPTLATLAGPR